MPLVISHFKHVYLPIFIGFGIYSIDIIYVIKGVSSSKL